MLLQAKLTNVPSPVIAPAHGPGMLPSIMMSVTPLPCPAPSGNYQLSNTALVRNITLLLVKAFFLPTPTQLTNLLSGMVS